MADDTPSIDEEPADEFDDSIGERTLWCAVLSAGIAGCVSGDRDDIGWIANVRSYKVGSFNWVCASLSINCREDIRKAALGAKGKFANQSEFLRTCMRNDDIASMLANGRRSKFRRPE